MEEAGTEEGEKNPEWEDSKPVLSVSQLNQVTRAFGIRVWRNSVVASGQLSEADLEGLWHWASEGKEAKMEVDLKEDGGEAMLFTIELT